MSVRELRSRVDFREFLEWEIYERVEPFQCDRVDYAGALLAAILANVNRDPEKRKQPYQVTDFLPPWQLDRDDGEPERMSAEETVAAVKALHAALGGS